MSMKVFPEMNGMWDRKLKGKTCSECGLHSPSAWMGPEWKKTDADTSSIPLELVLGLLPEDMGLQLLHAYKVDSDQQFLGASRPSFPDWAA